MALFDEITFEKTIIINTEILEKNGWQTKDLTSSNTGVFNYLINKNLKVIRSDGAKNQSLSGWILIENTFSREKYVMKFEKGTVSLIEEALGHENFDDFSEKKGAYWSEEYWN